ncbi:MAG TPA: glycosyltransferase 87 family protein [Actinomycetota bacterium]|nr:glycosyltransferase 87 family protein [Actinomycetota bacterium]
MSAARRTPGLALVLAATVATLAAGYLLKLPCLTAAWTDGRQYTRLCYSDVAALYASNDRERGLDDGRFPYLGARNEYPVLTGLAMGAAAWPADSYPSFFHWTAVLLGASALATSWALHRIAGSRALYLALAPTLAIYAFMNWDLIAVALATVATLAHLRGRDRAAGVLLGLGIAAKLYPVFVLIAMLAGRLRQGRRRDAAAMAGTAGGAWLAVNLPFALLAPGNWSEFYRFNSARGADWDSVWYVLARHLGFSWSRLELNLLAALAFVGASALIVAVARRRDPGRPTWTFAFPVLVAFLLTSKVYSPQFSLWLIPWFALTLPSPWLFAAFSVADAAVFVTRFQFFARLADVGPGVPFEAFEVALGLRAAVLVACVVAWVWRAAPERAPAPQPALEAT